MPPRSFVVCLVDSDSALESEPSAGSGKVQLGISSADAPGDAGLSPSGAFKVSVSLCVLVCSCK